MRVQGPRPENILFMVHEVFEALICESFHGVTYDFFVPCTNCLKMVRARIASDALSGRSVCFTLLSAPVEESVEEDCERSVL